MCLCLRWPQLHRPMRLTLKIKYRSLFLFWRGGILIYERPKPHHLNAFRSNPNIYKIASTIIFGELLKYIFYMRSCVFIFGYITLKSEIYSFWVCSLYRSMQNDPIIRFNGKLAEESVYISGKSCFWKIYYFYQIRCDTFFFHSFSIESVVFKAGFSFVVLFSTATLF